MKKSLLLLLLLPMIAYSQATPYGGSGGSFVTPTLHTLSIFTDFRVDTLQIASSGFQKMDFRTLTDTSLLVENSDSTYTVKQTGLYLFFSYSVMQPVNTNVLTSIIVFDQTSSVYTYDNFLPMRSLQQAGSAVINMTAGDIMEIDCDVSKTSGYYGGQINPTGTYILYFKL